MKRFGHLAQRMFNRPLAIHPAKAEVIVAALGERLGITAIIQADGELVALRPGAALVDDEPESFSAQGYDVEEGIARIEIDGTTVQKLGTLRPYSGMTGYDGIRQNFAEAMQDSRVTGIMLDIDSPGGEVSGLFDLVDMIYAARSIKPVWAILTECAYSAGYALASAAERILVPRTGGTGSIGVIWMHCDFSEAIAGAGVKVTVVKRGARKADGWPEVPLSKEAIARAQADIDAIGGIFEDAVARNRVLPSTEIRGMEAATFLGAESVSQGLADAVMPPDEAFGEFLDHVGR